MLQQITSQAQFLSFVPRLARLQKELDGCWAPDLDEGEFANEMVDQFHKGALVFLEECDSGFRYVIMLNIDPVKRHLGWLWLFYMNPQFREDTRNHVKELYDVASQHGLRRVRWSTTRTGSAYERWVSKFGATKYALMYQMEIY